MAEGEKSGFSSSALKTIDNASATAIQEGNLLAEISREVGEMNAWSLFWDCRVPKKGKGFMTLDSSDPEVLRGAIKKYETFYGEMKAAMSVIRTGEKGGIDVLEDKVDDLYEKLEEMSLEAESSVDSTKSRKLARLHQEFVSKHQKLENMVRRVESVGMRQKQKILTAKWEESLKDLQNLTKQLEEAKTDKDEIKKCVEDLKKDNENSKAERLQLLEQNTQILAALNKLVQGRSSEGSTGASLPD